MLSLNIVNIDVRWRQYCRTLAVGNKIISSEKNAQPHLKNGFRNARDYGSSGESEAELKDEDEMVGW